MPAIFIVDDDADILFSLEAWFRTKSYNVKTFENGRELVNNILKHRPELVLLDVNLKGEDGRHICRDIKESVRYPVKVLLSSASPSALLTYEYNFADGIINKPFELKTLEEKCRKLLTVQHGWYS